MSDWVTFGVTVCGGLVVAALLAVVLSRQRHGLPEIDEGMLGAEAARSVPEGARRLDVSRAFEPYPPFVSTRKASSVPPNWGAPTWSMTWPATICSKCGANLGTSDER